MPRPHVEDICLGFGRGVNVRFATEEGPAPLWHECQSHAVVIYNDAANLILPNMVSA